MTFETVEKARQFLESSLVIGWRDGFDLARYCASLILDGSSETDGRDLAIRYLNNSGKFSEETRPVWNDVLEAYGLHPYVSKEMLSLSSAVRHEFHKSPYLGGDIYFHSDQAKIASDLRSGRSIIASAPTSFGKSLLIDEVVASGAYKNIVVIQPTLALLDETRKRFRKFRKSYHMVLSTGQHPASERGNLFLFTAERVVEYGFFPKIDFFVIDEFYKLSLNREDDRAIVLNQALYVLLKHTKRFYLLGPPVDDVVVPDEKVLPCRFLKSNFSTVATDEYDLSKSYGDPDQKREVLFKQLAKLNGHNEQTIIYCAAPAGAVSLSRRFGAWRDDSSNRIAEWTPAKDVLELCHWIAENISSDWCLMWLLKSGIAFHHGALPRHLGSAIVDAFNRGKIKYLFCTATLIEGVNTSAKNVVLFDKRKGIRTIDYFDFRNISGRSGRMNSHYVGRVFRFHDPPKPVDLRIDIPVFSQTDAPVELLVALDQEDLNENGRRKVEPYNGIDSSLRAVVRRHPSVSIDGQIEIVKVINENLESWRYFLCWRSFPEYDQLVHVLNLAWIFLRQKREPRRGVYSPEQLAAVSLQYARIKSIRGIINQQISSDYWMKREADYFRRVDAVVDNVLEIARHWFDYKLGVYLSVISDLQKYVYEGCGIVGGDYSAFAAQVENGFIDSSFSGLSEYGVPRSAIEKICRRLNADMSIEGVLESLRKADLLSFGFSAYELTRVRLAI